MPVIYNRAKQVKYRYGTGSNDYYVGIGVLESEIIGFPEFDAPLDNYPLFNDRPYEKNLPLHYKRRRLVFTHAWKGATWAWPDNLRTFTERIHGKRFRIEPDSVPGYYFIGRCWIASYERALRIGKVQVIVDAEPYMIKKQETTLNYTTDKTIRFVCDTAFDTPADIVITPTSTSGTLRIYCTAPVYSASSVSTIWDVSVDLDGTNAIHLDGLNKEIYRGSSIIRPDMKYAYPYFKPGANTIYLTSSIGTSSTVISYNRRSM